MARTPDQILSTELAKMHFALAQLQSRVEVLTEENSRLTAAAAPKPPDPPPQG